MHELAIAEGILRVIHSESQKSGFQRVLEIRLKIGAYSGIIPDCICEMFPIAAKGTVAENAKLEVTVIPAEFECPECLYKGPVDRKKACCPVCGSYEIVMTGGRELYIDSLKVD